MHLSLSAVGGNDVLNMTHRQLAGIVIHITTALHPLEPGLHEVTLAHCLPPSSREYSRPCKYNIKVLGCYRA
jgi:hypothetical protein